MKKHLSTILLIVIFIIGLSLLLYPTVSDYWNSLHQSKVIATYTKQVENMDKARYQQIWTDALTYNQTLVSRPNGYVLTPEQKVAYEQILDVSGDGVMCYVEIPAIHVSLPVYHGTDDTVLQIAVGHLEWSSLPVGGENSHCVISGHRGLPSAKLFTNLDRLVVGDVFMFRILDEVLTYEVDQILIVEPQEVNRLKIQKGEDRCTLVTCTPYGVNSHRLLIMGHRVENAQEAMRVRVTADAMQIEPLMVAPIVAMPILLVLLIVLMIPKKKKTQKGGEGVEDL